MGMLPPGGKQSGGDVLASWAEGLASRLEEVVWGVVPQVAPLWTSYALYRFESNARSATVLALA